MVTQQAWMDGDSTGMDGWWLNFHPSGSGACGEGTFPCLLTNQITWLV